VHHDLRVFPDPDQVAAAAAALVAEHARAAAGRFHLALSGGRTPWTMLERLADLEVPWARVVVYQVDERVAPDGDDARNFTHIKAALQDVAPELHAMPVTDSNLEGACDTYAASLPERFDLVHLGLGPDGHTASLVPGDPVLDVDDRLIALTSPYQDHRRMTMTYRALARADALLWLVTGAEKQDALAKLLANDPAIPATHVEAKSSVVLADEAAALNA
jgi:6-phosphogluconolactonase